MIKHGPIDVIVFACGEPKFDGSILAELERQSDKGAIRVLDALVLFKDEHERCWELDLEELPAEEKAVLDFIGPEARGLLNTEDAETLYEGMVPGSAIVALAIEHTWAVDLVNAIDANGVELALNFRVPAPLVDEAFASLELTQ